SGAHLTSSLPTFNFSPFDHDVVHPLGESDCSVSVALSNTTALLALAAIASRHVSRNASSPSFALSHERISTSSSLGLSFAHSSKPLCHGNHFLCSISSKRRSNVCASIARAKNSVSLNSSPEVRRT